MRRLFSPMASGASSPGPSDQTDANGAPNPDTDSVASRQPTCVGLPPELWAEIFGHVNDPFDLWVNCRSISSIAKSEAERIFRLKYLPLLEMEWILQTKEIENFSLWARFDADIGTQDSSIASLKLQMHCSLYQCEKDRHRLKLGRRLWSEVERNAMVFKTLDYKDIDFRQRKEDSIWGYRDSIFKRKVVCCTSITEKHQMRVHLTTHPDCNIYSNDPDIPDLRVHLISWSEVIAREEWTEIGHISLDWKVLMDRFFGEEAIVRQQRPLRDTRLDQQITNPMFAHDIKQALPVEAPMEFGYASLSKSDDCYYITAYRQRLQESFALANMEIDLTPVEVKLIQTRVEWIREEARNPSGPRKVGYKVRKCRVIRTVQNGLRRAG